MIVLSDSEDAYWEFLPSYHTDSLLFGRIAKRNASANFICALVIDVWHRILDA